MDFSSPSIGELAWSNTNDLQSKVKDLERRIAALEAAMKAILSGDTFYIPTSKELGGK